MISKTVLRLLLPLIFLFSMFSSKAQQVSGYRLNDNIYYAFPKNGSTHNKPNTVLIIKSKIGFESKPGQDLFHISDQKGVEYMAQVFLKENNHTLVFMSVKPFNNGDIISFNLQSLPLLTGDSTLPINLEFSISNNRFDAINLEKNIFEQNSFYTKNKINMRGFTLPPDFPYYDVSLNNLSNTGEFYFQATQTTPFYQMITDPAGIPYYYRRTSSRTADFKVNKNGHITYFDFGVNKFVEIDSSYQFTRYYSSSPGLQTNYHELLVLPNGHYYTIGDEYIITNMTQYVECGDPHATVLHYVIEEKDAEDIPLWVWRTFDHFNVMDGDTNQVNFCGSSINFAHVNSIDIAPDSNVIISSRKLNEITKIDKSSGEILWRFGGNNNQFTIVNDPLYGFTDQHTASEDEEGVITVFDNGTYHATAHSRGLSYQMDLQHMKATCIQVYDDNEPIVATNPMGSMQVLENGNVVVGWAYNTTGACITEYDPFGNKVMIMEQTELANIRSYRSLKHAWKTNILQLSTDTVDFGNDNEPGGVFYQELNVYNPMDSNIQITGSYFSTPVFGIQESLPLSIDAHDSAKIQIVFSPVFAGAYNATGYLMSQGETFGNAIDLYVTASSLVTNISKISSGHIDYYPNPMANVLNIQTNDEHEGYCRIHSSLGELMFCSEINPGTSILINVDQWSPGLYLITFNGLFGVETRKVIKQ